MIKDIIENGFSALVAYTFILSVIILGVFLIAVLINAFTKRSKLNVEEIRKVLLMCMGFAALFAVLDYFLIC